MRQLPQQAAAVALPGESALSPARDLQELSRFWSALIARRRLFFTIFFGFVALVAIGTVLTPKTYTTTARLMPGSASSSGSLSDRSTDFPILNALVLQNGDQSAETFAALAQQDNVAQTVVNRLKLKMSAQALLGRVSVRPVVNTQLLNLSVTWRTREGSAAVANAFADAFIDSERDFVRSQAVSAMHFLSQELPAAQQRMHDAADKLAQFQSQNGFVDPGSHTQSVVAQAGAIDTQISTLDIDRREAVALLGNVRSQMNGVDATVNNSKQIAANPLLSDLKSRLTTTELQLAAAQQQYTDQHPSVISLKKQRDDLRAQIAAQPATVDNADTYAPNPIFQSLQQQSVQYQARIEGDNAKLAELQRQRGALAPVLRALPVQGMQLADLQQRARLTGDVYNALQKKYNDATIAETTAISDVTVVQPANPAAAVVWPSLRINLAIAVAVGLLLASLVIFALDFVARKMRDASDVTTIMGLPVVATIPEFASSNERALPWLQSLTVEAFLHLCVWLRLSKHRPLRTLALTSPSQGDGKSTTAFNLAKAMAKVEQRILLIDGDMRQPTLHELAHKSNLHGLSDVLAGRMRLEDAVHEIAPNLDLLTSGRDIGNPIGLIESSIFDDLLHTAERTYAMVIIDTLPATFIPEAISICAKVDGVLLVVAANTTEERAARRLAVQLETLGLDNILGVVLNRERARFHDYSDYFATTFQPSLPEAQ
ncbi:MAG TPA: polysaccharide biosynthesis tyrosine autokinase [Candidatus Baltobacteraceae bacterium]|nr:polysaccharide biosynthesis tyrosine autokinase [Candidatus Baltobacteraceae bacterium]